MKLLGLDLPAEAEHAEEAAVQQADRQDAPAAVSGHRHVRDPCSSGGLRPGKYAA